MSYAAVVQLARSSSLLDRVAAAAAKEGQDSPQSWALERAWRFAAEPGWAEAWAYAKDTQSVNVNPDTGAREDVISDAMILAAVQARIGDETAASSGML